MNLVFLVGTGRCGSTMVHEVLAKHEMLGFVSNIEDNLPGINTFGRWNNTLYRSVLGRYTRKGGVRFAPSEAYNLISKEVSPIYANSCRDLYASDVTPWLEARFKRFFEIRNEKQGKTIFSHKYTGWSRMGFFTKIFPQARFIHVVRDGRAVANSWLQMPWWGGYRGPENWLWGGLQQEVAEDWEAHGKAFHYLAALSWKILMESFHQAEEFLDEDVYLKLKYEDIVSNPREKFEEILRFCGIPWTSAFERQFDRQIFRQSRSRSFEKDLTRKQIEDIGNALVPILEQYGYE